MAVDSPSSSTHSLLTQPGPTPRRPAPLDTSKFTTESPRPTPLDLYSLFPPTQGLTDDDILLMPSAPHGNDAFIGCWSTLQGVAVRLRCTWGARRSLWITVLETVPTFVPSG